MLQRAGLGWTDLGYGAARHHGDLRGRSPRSLTVLFLAKILASRLVAVDGLP